MNFEDFVEQLKRHEGVKTHVYKDSLGILTGGVGHAFLEGSPLHMPVVEMLLNYDLEEVSRSFAYLKLPLNPRDPKDIVRSYAIKNMLFQLGIVKFMGFKKMVAALRRRDFADAATQGLDSKWSSQTKNRAVEITDMIRTGQYKGG